MALTATANQKVVQDAIRVLGMSKPFEYRSSFNRPNLSYEVRKKDSKTIDTIAAYIASRPNDSGVIYCLSRKDCETLSDKLTKKLIEKGIRNFGVSFYHAELEIQERQRRHHEWLVGRVSVLCATIAFGMGIDKPDVRYVMHYSMPKSITHYYQESGRAGRDGDKADCILFYAYKDKRILEMMIRKSANNPRCSAMRRKIDQLYSCLRYCENEFLCRRTMQLEFFGEKFDRAKCKKTCDNCISGMIPERRNLTTEGLSILNLLDDLLLQRNGHTTLSQMTELYRGSKSKQATKFINVKKMSSYGSGAKYSKTDVDRIMHALVFENILEEYSETNARGFNTDFVRHGIKADSIRNGSHQFNVDFPKAAPRKSSKKKDNSLSAKEKQQKETKASPKKSSISKKTMSLKNGKIDVANIQTIDDSDDDEFEFDDLPSSARKIGTKAKSPEKSILPKNHTDALIERIKKLVSLWAEEEMMNGNQVFYWNIMNNQAMSTIATHVPLTIEELNDLAVVGENIVKEYGERLIKQLKSFVDQNKLDKYLAGKSRKRQKNVGQTKKASTSVAPKKDEYDTEIDFSMIDIPVVNNPSKKSSYFN